MTWICSCGQGNSEDLVTCAHCYEAKIHEKADTVIQTLGKRSNIKTTKTASSSTFEGTVYTSVEENGLINSSISSAKANPISFDDDDTFFAQNHDKKVFRLTLGSIGLSVLGCFIAWFLGFNHHSNYRASLAVDLADNFLNPTFENVYLGKLCTEREGYTPYGIFGWEDVPSPDTLFVDEHLEFQTWRGFSLCVKLGPNFLSRVFSRKTTSYIDGISITSHSCPDNFVYCGASECVSIPENQSAESVKCPITDILFTHVASCHPTDLQNGTCIMNRSSGLLLHAVAEHDNLPIVALRANTIAIPFDEEVENAISAIKVCDRATMSGPLDPTCSLEIPDTVLKPRNRPPRPDAHVEYNVIDTYPAFTRSGSFNSTARLATYAFYADNFQEKYAWRDVTIPEEPFSLPFFHDSENVESKKVGYPALFSKTQTDYLFSKDTTGLNCTMSMVQSLVNDRESFTKPLNSSTWWMLLPLSMLYTIYSFGMIVPSLSAISVFSAKNSFYGSTVCCIASLICAFLLIVKGIMATSTVPEMVQNSCLNEYMLDVMQYDVVEGLQFYTITVSFLFTVFLFDLVVRGFLYSTSFSRDSFDFHYALFPCCLTPKRIFTARRLSDILRENNSNSDSISDDQADADAGLLANASEGDAIENPAMYGSILTASEE